MTATIHGAPEGFDALLLARRRAEHTGEGGGSVLHVARDGYRPTEGCVALARADLLRLLRRLGPRTHLRIG